MVKLRSQKEDQELSHQQESAVSNVVLAVGAVLMAIVWGEDVPLVVFALAAFAGSFAVGISTFMKLFKPITDRFLGSISMGFSLGIIATGVIGGKLHIINPERSLLVALLIGVAWTTVAWLLRMVSILVRQRNRR